MKANCQIIVPVENGFVVIPYTMDTLHRVNGDMPVMVASDVHQLKEVVGDLYKKPPGDTNAND